MAEYFDKIAHRYDEWYKTKVGGYVDKTEKKLVFSMIKTKHGNALDLGCGTGNYTLELYKRGFQVVGVDISRRMLKIAQKKLPNVKFIKANAYSLPFEDNTFDLVLSVTMLEFIHEPEKVLSEVYRVLKPGGEAVIGTMNGKSMWFIFKRMKSLFVETAYRYARFYTPKELENLMKNAGFKETESRGIIYLPSFFPFVNISERLDEKFSDKLKNLGAFIVVRGVKGD
ncbi:MAG TPA: class I SAM-dependent methyltransferase [Thermococcus sp.]|uniref:class I SAM-dependent methyltransferase n=1 Tax=Thermococcus sp. TaxID=35749 RepID=UPI000F2AF597|nr:class I SAM-dependent methyltransferase [Thermococcus sp.]RLF78914.1 MAG: ubiquinone biosynthesis protein UbiE [Thermococci archaeon]MCD6140231.1 methyltransferase domain-containing protein [Thermococcus sp.]MCD6143771.1 methyltransferase domain-containing protein [Thermococcus sp.]RLF82680.1 MAG: ubiquinone biosynthesis protein UbiE [Thermococci archaeon]HDH44528.1 class I SAM-dependent methyltransferase [Thermococcus sp.]